MSTRFTERLAVPLALAAVLGLAAACGRPASGPSGAELTIATNTQDEFRDLRLGAANIREDDYTDEKGAKAHGLVALLRVYVRGKPAENQSVNVHEGQVLGVAGYSVLVSKIALAPKAGVTVKIAAP